MRMTIQRLGRGLAFNVPSVKQRAVTTKVAMRGIVTIGVASLAACSSSNNSTADATQQIITPAIDCSSLQAQLALQDTTIESVELDAGGETNLMFRDAGPRPENCVVSGMIGAYTSIYVDPDTGSNAYGTHFELRMPTQWNGRFFFQAGGGGDGFVATADGVVLGAFAQTEPALWQGFAVVTSDSGHQSANSEVGLLYAGFGIDPTARINYGYAYIGQVTPIAKQIIGQYYARQPVHSYFIGCSKGGQEAMQASQKYGDQFDGIVAGDPGFHLPHAAIAEAWNTQALAPVALANNPGVDKNGNPLLYNAFSKSDLGVLRQGVLQACDALDGVADGMVFNTAACVGKFDPATLQCAGAKTASCLTAAQVVAVGKIFGGAKDSNNSPLYASFPYDTDMDGFMGWVMWDLGLPLGSNNSAFNVTLAQESSAYVFTTAPDPSLDMFTVNVDQFAQNITATSGDYNVSSVDFMEADSTDLDALKGHGGKIIYFHGASDPVFSMNDTIDYYNQLTTAYGNHTADFARLFLVPGMNHCGGGAYTTDSFDALDAIVNWVEKGRAPDTLTAHPSAPSSSSLPAGTTRPLCAYPKYAHYNGSGDVNDAASFTCESP